MTTSQVTNAESQQSRQKRLTTLGALCCISVIKGADLQLLPASFRAMEVDLQLKPYALGILALSQGVACAVAGPFWGNLVDSGMSRRSLLMSGAICWGTCTFMLAFATKFSVMAFLRVCNGASLAMLLPVIQSFVVDLSPSSERGYTFGWLFFFSNLGQVSACLFVTPISNQTIFGLAGWRAALAIVGILSWMIAGVIPFSVHEEPRKWKGDRVGIAREFRKLGKFMKIPTFNVIILQGIFGTIPGASLSFLTMYFQYTGISDAFCALLNAFHVVGDAIGGLLGGLIGDNLAGTSPKYGRAITAQVSLVLAMPFLYLIFIAFPHNESEVVRYAGLLLLHGLFSSWVAPGCICPVMTDIIPRRNLASAYAWELSMVFCSGNTLGPLLVGWMSQRLFGYKLNTQQVDTMSEAARQANAKALGKALFFCSALPTAVCAVLFSFLYCTYAKDSRKATEDGGVSEEASSSGAERVKADENTHLLGKRSDGCSQA